MKKKEKRVMGSEIKGERMRKGEMGESERKAKKERERERQRRKKKRDRVREGET